MKQLYFLLIACFVGLAGASAQQVRERLPRWMTATEAAQMDEYLQSRPDFARITTPPTQPVRTMAEWEEIQALQITWTGWPNVLAEIVDHAQQECEVIIVCSDSNAVKTSLQNNGVTPTNCTYLITGFNSIWCRDYGAHTVYYNDVDSMAMIDWIYNRPRPADDLVPQAVADHYGVTLYEMTTSPNDLMNTGGNWMVDGMGTAMASELILDENDGAGEYSIYYPNHTVGEIDDLVETYHGVDRYIKMETLPYDGIHHIDMHMKLLDEETILVSQYPDGESDGPQIEANIDYVLNNYQSAFGTPYIVKHVPVPPSTSGLYPAQGGWYRTYSNQVFVNKTVIVPTYREEYDSTAMRLLQEYMPGYNIVGIDCDDQISQQHIISQSGAIHCITKAVGVDDPLWITHQAIRSTTLNTPQTVDATIKHVSGIASATLYWTTDLGAGYQSLPMSNAGGDVWTADIPGQPGGTDVYYYVQGVANNGKQQVRPIVAPDGYWKYSVWAVPTGLAEHSNHIGLSRVYPNPAAAMTAVQIDANIATEGTVTLYDVLGQPVQVLHNGRFIQGTNRFFFDASDLSGGIYSIVLETHYGTEVQKVVVR